MSVMTHLNRMIQAINKSSAGFCEFHENPRPLPFRNLHVSKKRMHPWESIEVIRWVCYVSIVDGVKVNPTIKCLSHRKYASFKALLLVSMANCQTIVSHVIAYDHYLGVETKKLWFCARKIPVRSYSNSYSQARTSMFSWSVLGNGHRSEI
jgi:hypothetical protein